MISLLYCVVLLLCFYQLPINSSFFLSLPAVARSTCGGKLYFEPPSDDMFGGMDVSHDHFGGSMEGSGVSDSSDGMTQLQQNFTPGHKNYMKVTNVQMPGEQAAASQPVESDDEFDIIDEKETGRLSVVSRLML